MILKNGLVFDINGDFVEKDLCIENNVIVSEPSINLNHEIVDISGLYVIPGLVDVHTHGALGHDFSCCTKEELKEIAAFEKSQGIAAFCPTSMTLPLEDLKKAFSLPKQLEADPEIKAQPRKYAKIPGINMEGPFISEGKKGAQNSKYIRTPDLDFFKSLWNISGQMIKLMTIAPEADGSMEFIRNWADKVHISLGHSCCDYDTAKAAFNNGADHVTHLYNGMNGAHHRTPGIIEASADTEGIYVELLSDGVHVHPAVVRNTFRLYKDRVVLISDSMEACGMPDGDYQLGGQQVIKKDIYARLIDGTIAGSASTLMDCLKRAVDFGVPFAEAVKAATYTPAKSIGMEQLFGSLRPGTPIEDILLVKFNKEKQTLEKVSALTDAI